MAAQGTLGFIGLGVMGEPICSNLVRKSGRRVLAFDLAPETLARLRVEGADVAADVAAVVADADVVFLCLPSAEHVRRVVEDGGLGANCRSGQIVVDLGTSAVALTRELAARLDIDMPIATTTAALLAGETTVDAAIEALLSRPLKAKRA